MKSKLHSVSVYEYKDAKEFVRCKRVHVVTELFNIAVNDFDAKESVRCNQTRCKRTQS